MLSSAGHSINYQLNMRNNRIYSNFSALEQVELLSKFPESTVYLINPSSFYNLTRRERLCISQTDWLNTVTNTCITNTLATIFSVLLKESLPILFESFFNIHNRVSGFEANVRKTKTKELWGRNEWTRSPIHNWDPPWNP